MDYSKFSDETLKKIANNEELDYSKLSDDELRELSKETAKPKAVAPNGDFEKYSGLESFARGAAQGASFGFADELTAAGEAALTDKTYDQALAESRAEYTASADEDPITAILGNVAGGFAVPGIGAIKAGSSAAKALQAGGLAKAASQGVLGRTILGSAAELAAGGALAGAGASEQKGMDILGDAATGAGVGLVGGAAIGATGALLGKGLEVARKTQLAKDIAEKYALSKQFGSQIGKAAENKKALDESIKKIVTELRDAKKENVKDYTALLKMADEQSTSASKVSDMVSKLEVAKVDNPGSAPEIQKIIDTLNNIGKKKVEKVEKLVPKKGAMSKVNLTDAAEAQAQVALQTKRTEFKQKIDFLSGLLEKTDNEGAPLIPHGPKRDAIIGELEAGLNILDNIEQNPTLFADKNNRYGFSGLFDNPESFINRMKPIEKEISKGHKVITGYEMPDLRMIAKGSAKKPQFKMAPDKLVTEMVDETTYADDIINPSKAQEIKKEVGDILYGGGKFPEGMTKTLGSDILSESSKIRAVADDTVVGQGLKAADITHKAVKEAEELLKDIDVQGLNRVSEEQKLIALNKFARKLAQESEAGITANDTMDALRPRLEQALGKEKASALIDDLFLTARKYKVSADLGQEAAFGGLNPVTLGMPQRTAALTVASEVGNTIGNVVNQFKTSALNKGLQKVGVIKPKQVPHKEMRDLLTIADQLDPETAAEITNKLATKDPKIAGMFTRVLGQQGQTKRASLWALMQQPAFRQAMFEDEDEQ